jgi:CubicO group peptidase (beta-lactamase class C family)
LLSVALLTLYEEGRFHLDDPVSAFIPEFSELKVLEGMTERGPKLADLERPVTIRHLFTHTAGLCYPNPDGLLIEKLMAEAMGPPGPPGKQAEASLEEWIPLLVKAPLAHQPGSGWTYGFSLDVLGRLVEVMSGNPFDDFLKERVLDPLGMVDTDFFVPPEKRGRMAKVYSPKKQGGLETVAWATDNFLNKPRFLSGGGGLVSTAVDYLRFSQMLLNGGMLDRERVLGRETVRLMMSSHTPGIMDLPEIREGKAFGRGFAYGLGGRVLMDDSVGLAGSAGSFPQARFRFPYGGRYNHTVITDIPVRGISVGHVSQRIVD